MTLSNMYDWLQIGPNGAHICSLSTQCKHESGLSDVYVINERTSWNARLLLTLKEYLYYPDCFNPQCIAPGESEKVVQRKDSLVPQRVLISITHGSISVPL